MKKKLIVVLCLLLAASCLFTACSSGTAPDEPIATQAQAPQDQQGQQSLAVATKIPTQYPDYFDRKNDDTIGLGFKLGLKAAKADAQLKQKPVAWLGDLENAIDDYGRTVCIWSLQGLTMKFEYSEKEIADGVTLGTFTKDLSDILYASYAGDGKCVSIDVYDSSALEENNNERFTLLRGMVMGKSTKADVEANFCETTGASGDYFYKGQFAEKTYTHDAFGKKTTFDGKEAYLYVYPVDNQKDELIGTDKEVYRSVYFVFNAEGVIERMLLQQTPYDANWDK